jgi:hypothetical protein
MRLEKSIILHLTEEAKKEWEEKEKPIKKKKFNCPSCEVEELKIKNDYINNTEEKSE